MRSDLSATISINQLQLLPDCIGDPCTCGTGRGIAKWAIYLDKLIYCTAAGFPAEVTTAILALIDDTSLLSEAHDAWNEWGEGDIEDLIEAITEVTGDLCSFCEKCSDLMWNDDSTMVDGGDRVCDENCRDDYYVCYHCEDWFKETTSVGDREYCENCLENQCSFCTWCDRWILGETTSVGDNECCNSCLSSNFSYCDNCEEYYHDEDDNHDHDSESGCDCDVPHFYFKFPADGHGLVQQDERLTVELPKGTIDNEGITRIKKLLNDELGWSQAYIVNAVIDEIGPVWQTKRGNFTRRLSSTLYKQGNIKLQPTVVSEVGNIAQAHSSSGATWHVEFTRDLNQSADYFYHDDSCWWQSYSYSRCALKNWGGLGLRTFYGADTSNHSPSGRVWVQPLRNTDRGLVPTHDAEGADAYVIFNGYAALSGYMAARIVAHLAGRTYRRVLLNTERMYVNGDTGYLVADEATCENTESLNFYFGEHDQQDARTYLDKKEAAA